jgi:signal transduction histidine kinase
LSEHSAEAQAPPTPFMSSLAGWTRDGPSEPIGAFFTSAIAAAAVGATAGAVYLSAVSRHAPNPAGHAVISVVVCLSFVGAGLLALHRPPYVRLGLPLALVGFSSLLGALHDANGAIPYTIGVFTANLVFALLITLLLAFPSGRLGTRANRLMALAAFVNVLGIQALAVIFDPLTRWKSDHPPNKALIASHPDLATALEELEAAIAIALALAVAGMLFRWARSKTPVARRRVMPILVGGDLGLLLFGIGLVLAPLSSRAAVIGIGGGLLASVALPVVFVAGLLQGRLSRAAVGELLLELREGTAAVGLQDALRRALGDPSLDLVRRTATGGVYRGADGRPITLPGPGDPRMATPIVHQGDEIGMLVHDRVLHLQPELLDAVSAAAGFALANEQSLETVQRMERRNRALLDAIPDLMFRVSRDGVTLDIRADDPSALVLSVEEQLGRNVREFLPADVADAAIACIERALETGAMSSIEYELEIRGELRIFESRMVPSGPNEVVTIVRDFTEQRRAELQQRLLAEEQAALRRVATLVAGDAPPELVFQSVTEQVCRALGIREAVLERYEGNNSSIVLGRYGSNLAGYFDVGTVIPLEEGLAVTTVLRTGEPARVDYAEQPGEVAKLVRELGFRSAVAAPIKVAGSTWGTLIAALREGESLPPETERRLSSFAALVALGLASAQAREELEASRLRIFEASDAERRRLERNLHDGAQQRLVALSVALRMTLAKLDQGPEEARELLEVAAAELSEALTELRELAQGIHPAVLTDRGLEAALEVLASRTPLPVALDLRLKERLPEPTEAAAYYVVSEALANVVKHARAEKAAVRLVRSGGSALVEVEDNGEGGACLDGGSGLRGLLDRVETLDGWLEIESGTGRGTLVRASLPLR